jgi:hypothetical protein
MMRGVISVVPCVMNTTNHYRVVRITFAWQRCMQEHTSQRTSLVLKCVLSIRASFSPSLVLGAVRVGKAKSFEAVAIESWVMISNLLSSVAQLRGTIINSIDVTHGHIIFAPLDAALSEKVGVQPRVDTLGSHF